MTRSRTCSSTATTASSPRAWSTTWRCSAGRSGDDRDIFTPAELVAGFDGHRISGNPARFDRKKAEAINGAHIRLLAAGRLRRSAGGLPGRPRRAAGRAVRRAAGAGAGGGPAGPGAVRAAVRRRRDDRASCSSPTGDFAVDPAAAAQGAHRGVDAGAGGRRSRRWRRCPSSPPAALEPALKAALIDELGLKPKLAFQPVRVAVTGPDDLAAAVRVDGAARSGADPRPAAGGAAARASLSGRDRRSRCRRTVRAGRPGRRRISALGCAAGSIVRRRPSGHGRSGAHWGMV